MQTYAEFKRKIKGRLWPTGEQLSLVAAHDAAFQTAMLDLQHWVPCLKEFNVSTFESADRLWESAKTLIPAPFGMIRRIYTVAGGLDRWRDKVFYRSSTFQEIECWAKRLYRAVTPVNLGLAALSYGVKYEEAASDSQFGRARVGAWAIYRGKLYVAPWLQTKETLVVEWDGEKTAWHDSDGVDENLWRPDVEAAVEYFVGFRHNIYYGDKSLAADLLKLYERARADLMHWCREYTRMQESYVCGGDGGGAELVGRTGSDGTDISGDDDDPTEDTTDDDHVLFAAVGDMGDPTTDAAAVALAIKSETPERFIPLGDNTYNSDYPNDFGVNYQWAIDQKILIPVPGNHDWDVDNTLASYKAYFANFLKNNGNNYEATIGPIHFLIYDNDARFEDGFDASSIQAEWLRVKLLLSTARWKIVLMHRPPYSSDTVHGSDTDLQMQFKSWGAHVVLSGHAHDYERLLIGGLNYFVCGTGGRPLYPFGVPVDGSVVRVEGSFGYLIGEADCDKLVITFKNTNGTVLDSVTITDASTSGGSGGGENVPTDAQGNVLTDGNGNVLTG